MKTNHGLLWSEEHADKTITLGFTKTAIENQLQECFHVFQADTKEVREKGPLLVLETNDGLQSIKAPFAGRVSYFNPKARNFPDRIKETDTILTLVPKGVVVKKPAPEKKSFTQIDAMAPFIQQDVNQQAAAGRPARETVARPIDVFNQTLFDLQAAREREATIAQRRQDERNRRREEAIARLHRPVGGN